MAAFAPEVITHIGNFPITNTLIHTLLVDAFIITLAVTVGKNVKKIPQRVQNIVEMVVEGFYNLTESIAGKSAKAIFPFVMSFFLFIFIANITALLPGVGSIGIYESHQTAEQVSSDHPESAQSSEVPQSSPSEEEHTSSNGKVFVPLFRGATSDINLTLALAIISVIATHYLSIKFTGIRDYISRYLSFNPVYLYVGLLEMTAELTKIISLSFRLFGNIFAGEVALHTVSNLFAFLFPLPFLALESIVAVVQALVFSILTLVFMAILTTPHHAHEESPTHH